MGISSLLGMLSCVWRYIILVVEADQEGRERRVDALTLTKSLTVDWVWASTIVISFSAPAGHLASTQFSAAMHSSGPGLSAAVNSLCRWRLRRKPRFVIEYGSLLVKDGAIVPVSLKYLGEDANMPCGSIQAEFSFIQAKIE